MKNVSDKSCRENQNTHFMSNNSFFSKMNYKIMWKNIVEAERQPMIVWRMNCMLYTQGCRHTLRICNIRFPTAKMVAWKRLHGTLNVHSCQQKSIGVKFSKSRTGSDVRYSCHHNSSRFTFPHICAFVAFLCPPFITINHTAYILVLTEDNNTLLNF